MMSLIVLPIGAELSSGDATEAGIQSLEYTESVNSGTDLTLGSACANCIDLKVLARAGDVQISAGDELTYYRVDETGARTKIGVFTAEKPTQKSENLYSCTAYDHIAQTDVDLSDWVADLTGWPYTLQAFAGMVCAKLGLPLATTDLPNGAYPIQRFAVSKLTGRKLLQWIGEASGRFCRANADGSVEFAWYVMSDDRIGASDSEVHYTWVGQDGQLNGSDGLMLFEQVGSVDSYVQDGLARDEYQTAVIDKVQIRQSDTDNGVVYPNNDTAAANTYVVQGNYLLLGGTSAALSNVAQTLYGILHSVAYTPSKITVFAQQRLHAGDIVQVTDNRGRKFSTYIMQRTVSGGREALESTGNRSRESTTAVNYQSYSDIRSRVLEISTTVDGLSIKAADLSGNYSELSQTVDQISSRVSAAALGNLLQYPNFMDNPTSLGISTQNSVVTMIGGGNRTNRRVYCPITVDGIKSSIGNPLTFTVEYKVIDEIKNAYVDGDPTNTYWYLHDMRIYVYTDAGILTWDHFDFSTAVSTDWVKACVTVNIPNNDAITKIQGSLTLQGATGTILFRNPSIGYQTIEMYTELKQTVDDLTLTASTIGTTSTIKLTSKNIELSSASIDFTGLVTFEDLSTGGKTVINGDNITAGTINGLSVHFDLVNGRLYSQGVTPNKVVFSTLLDGAGLTIGNDIDNNGGDGDDPGSGSSGTNVIDGKMGLYCARFYGDRTCGALLLSAIPDPSEDYQGHSYVFGTGDAEFSGTVTVYKKLFAQNLTYGSLFGYNTVWRTITIGDITFTALCQA